MLKPKINSHPKIIKCVQSMMMDTVYKLPFYGNYNLMLNFKELPTIPTCGVNVSRNGMNFYYNSKFLDKLPQEEVNFIDIHEIFHLLFNHPTRTVSGKYDPMLANVAQDMIINSIIWSDIRHEFVQIPKDEKGENMALFLPVDYEGEEIFEVVYNYLYEEREKYRKEKQKEKDQDDQQDKNVCSTCNGSGESESKEDSDPNNNDNDTQSGNSPNGEEGESEVGTDPNSNNNGNGDNDDDDSNDKSDNSCEDCNGTGKNPELDSTGKPKYGKYGKSGDQIMDTYSLESIFDNLEKTQGQYMDTHIEDNVPESLRDNIVKEAVDKLKARGLVEGNLKETIRKLRKSRKDYLKEIKRSVSQIIGSGIKKRTITRPNRRGIKGLKGNRKYKTRINVLLDTSGSMSGVFNKVLSYIFQRNIEINLVQCDTQVQDSQVISNINQLNKIEVKGLGGTVIQPGVDHIVENYNDYNTVILTDGFTDNLDFSDHKGKVLILTTDQNCRIEHQPKKSLKQIWIDTSYDNGDN